METDVVLHSPERQIMLDCKFYEQAFKSKGEASPCFNSKNSELPHR